MWARERARLSAVARGQSAADRYVRGALLLNVYTGEVYPANVAIAGERIAYVGLRDDMVGRRTDVIDAAGTTLVPGYIEPHAHPWNLGTPAVLARHVLPLGTTAIFGDNLVPYWNAGLRGFEQSVAALARGPLKFYWMIRPPRPVPGGGRGAPLPAPRARPDARQPLVRGDGRGHALARRARRPARAPRAPRAGRRARQAHRGAHRGGQRRARRRSRRRGAHVGPRADQRAGGARPRAAGDRAHAPAILAAAGPPRAARAIRQVRLARTPDDDDRREHARPRRRARVRRRPGARGHGGRCAAGRGLPDGDAQPRHVLRQGRRSRRHRARPLRRPAAARRPRRAAAARGHRPRPPRRPRRPAARPRPRAAVEPDLHPGGHALRPALARGRRGLCAARRGRCR